MKHTSYLLVCGVFYLLYCLNHLKVFITEKSFLLQGVWMKTAKSNSDLFEQVFGGVCIPTGAATNFEELKEFRVSTIIYRSNDCNI